jgi:hypothetical protein
MMEKGRDVSEGKRPGRTRRSGRREGSEEARSTHGPWKQGPWKREPWRQEPSGRWSARTKGERAKVSKPVARDVKEGSSTYGSGLRGHVEVVWVG